MTVSQIMPLPVIGSAAVVGVAAVGASLPTAGPPPMVPGSEAQGAILQSSGNAPAKPCNIGQVVYSHGEYEKIVRDRVMNLVGSLSLEAVRALGWETKADLVGRFLKDSCRFSHADSIAPYPQMYPASLRFFEGFDCDVFESAAQNLSSIEVPYGPRSFELGFLLYHGTKSASLPGMIREGGLVPGGLLMTNLHALPPFMGEHGYVGPDMFGVHVNKTSLSFVLRHHRVEDSDSLRYAKDSWVWSKSRGQESIEKLRDLLEHAKEQDRVRGAEDDLTRQYEEHIRCRIELDAWRRRAYETLSPEDRHLIDSPFPIIVRVRDFDPKSVKLESREGSPVRGEASYSAPCKFGSEIDALFVRSNRVDFTRDYLARHEISGVSVYSIELLRRYWQVSSFWAFNGPAFKRP